LRRSKGAVEAVDLVGLELIRGSSLELLGLGGALRVERLHGGEEEDLLDVVLVGEEHDEAIDTETPATSGRQAVLHGRAETLVNGLSLVVTGSAVGDLALEQPPLYDGIVQLGVGVADLATSNEELETLSERGSAAVVLGERRHDLGVISDEGGRDALGLNEVANELVEQASVGERRTALDAVLLALHLEELVGLSGAKVRGELDAELLLEGGNHGDAGEGRSEVNVELGDDELEGEGIKLDTRPSANERGGRKGNVVDRIIES